MPGSAGSTLVTFWCGCSLMGGATDYTVLLPFISAYRVLLVVQHLIETRRLFEVCGIVFPWGRTFHRCVGQYRMPRNVCISWLNFPRRGTFWGIDSKKTRTPIQTHNLLTSLVTLLDVSLITCVCCCWWYFSVVIMCLTQCWLMVIHFLTLWCYSVFCHRFCASNF